MIVNMTQEGLLLYGMGYGFGTGVRFSTWSIVLLSLWAQVDGLYVSELLLIWNAM
jgi:hypothetical protein